MKPYTILVVEDNPVTRKMLRITLETEGYRVLEAPDGRVALDQAAQHSPDLILQDLILPDMDGLDLLRQLRNLPGRSQVPILALSGFVSRLEEAKMAGVGFDEILLKPVEPSHLVQTIPTFLPHVASGQEQAGRNRRVLVVDDDPIQRKLLALHLRSLDFQVETATDGAEGLERALAAPPDAILSDVFMPNLDGFALCLAVRRDRSLAGIPVVLFSSMYVDEADRALGLKVGANAWVDRSPDFKEAVEALLANLGRPAPVPATASADQVMAQYTGRLARQLDQQAALNASLTQRAALQAAELSVLSGISEALSRTTDLEAALEDILYRCLDAGGLSRGALYLTGPDGLPVLSAKTGYEDVPLEELRGFFGHADLLQAIIAAGDPVVIPSASIPEPAVAAILDRSKGTQSLIAPIKSQGKPLGAILMGTRSRTLTDEDWLYFARTVAVQIGQAIALSRAFAQLAASEQQLQHLLVSSPTVIYSLKIEEDASLVPLAISENIPRLLGYDAHEVIAASDWWAKNLHPEDRDRALAAIPALFSQGRLTHEYRFRHKDGTYRWIHDELRVSQGASGRPVEAVGSLVDITERKQTEEALRQSEKLAIMGQLLAGVAHELNNPLSIVMGLTTLLRMKTMDSATEDRTQKILNAAERCARIVKNFLALARQRPPERQRVFLNQVIQEAVELVAYQLRVSNVKVDLDLARDLPVLWADSHQLHQVVVNLLTNAQQAMRNSPPPRRIAFTTRFDAARNCITMEAADSGPGIPPEIQARIFDPFFTTKPVGEGTGLGLSLCQGIIEGHGGSIRVVSQPGEGAKFVIELPAAAPPAAAAEAQIAGMPVSVRGKTILVVDDEPVVTEVLADILSADGHTVDMATNGAAALEKIRGRNYDLIVTDVRMPDMDGSALYREVERHAPKFLPRFIFVTGDSLSKDTREFLKQTGGPTLNKPFIPVDVQRVVQQALLAAERAR